MTTLALTTDYGKFWQAEYTNDNELKAAYCNGQKVRLTPARIDIINRAFDQAFADATGNSFTHSLSQII